MFCLVWCIGCGSVFVRWLSWVCEFVGVVVVVVFGVVVVVVGDGLYCVCGW